jgi:hypothetical protein
MRLYGGCRRRCHRAKSPALAVRSSSSVWMLIPRWRKTPPSLVEKVMQRYLGEQLVAWSKSLRSSREALVPLIEGPGAECLTTGDPNVEDSDRCEGFRG